MWLEWLSHTLSASARAHRGEPRQPSRLDVSIELDEHGRDGEAGLDVAVAAAFRALEIADPHRR